MKTDLTVNQSISEQQTGAPLQTTGTPIRVIFRALASDYGDLFLAQFRRYPDYTPIVWAERLRARVYGCSDSEIYDGYELVISSLKRMPTTDEIVNSVKAVHRSRRDFAMRKSADQELTFTGGISGYVDALENATTSNPVAQTEIAKMREAVSNPVAQTEIERKNRITDAKNELSRLMLTVPRKIITATTAPGTNETSRQ